MKNTQTKKTIIQKKKENDAPKDTTDIGFYENEKLRQTQQQSEDNNIAVIKIRRVILGVLIGISLIVAVLLAILIRTNDNAQEESYNQKLEVPDVEKMLVDEATKTIRINGFEYTIEYVVDAEYAEGVVISQSPKGGQIVDNSILIKLKVSTGPELFEVPDIVNVSFSEAIAAIEQAGFLVGEVSQQVSELPSEYIVKQEPKAGTQIPSGEEINIWIAAQEETGEPIMPNLAGRSLQEAMYLLSSYDIHAELVEVVEIDSGFAEGTVVYHEPDIDSPIQSQQNITLYISNGGELAYTAEEHIILTLTSETTKVRIVYVDEETKQVVYNKSLTKGEHDILLTLYTNTLGEKDIIIYYDGVEKEIDIVTFEVSE